MKKAALLITTLLLLIYSCTSEKNHPFLSTNNIRLQIFTIDPLKENQIKGARGGLFTIPAGAFEGTGAVTIELKEVYTPIEILASGLSTESNGELLESGGMFYLNAKRDGKALTLKKEITGSIPADYINDSMKLFKGELKEDGSVNWIEPEALLPATDSNTLCIKEGERLFKTNCISCHAVDEKLTGPALINSSKYYSNEEYYLLLQNPLRFGSVNRRFNCLIHEYNGIIMTAFPALTRDDVNCLIEYFENEAKRRPDLAEKFDTKDLGIEGCEPYTDTFSFKQNPFPCFVDTFYVNEEFERIINNAWPADTIQLPTITNESDSLNIPLLNQPEERYEFKINTLGWYNIDILLKNLEGITEVLLDATTDFKNNPLVDIKLLFPEKKIQLKSTYQNSNNTFTFGNEENRIPLYIGDLAIMFAIAEENNKIFYAVTELRIKNEQRISLKLTETTKENLEAAFRKINLDNINLDRLTKKPIVVPINCNDSIPPGK